MRITTTEFDEGFEEGFHKGQESQKIKNTVSQSPFETFEEATERIDVLKAMEQYGGSFVKALGEALVHSDAINTRLIKNTWPEYWKEYKKIAIADKLKGDNYKNIC